MGLYDTIKCKFPLPLPEGIDLSEFGGKPIGTLVTFQTKGLGKGMNNYEIREDGTLWKELYDIKYVDDPGYSKKYSELFGTTVGGYQRAIKYNQTWVPYHVHNDIIEIYELYSPHDENYQNTTTSDYWMRYEVTFSNSVLLEVKLLEFEKRDRTEYEARMKILFDSMKPKFSERVIRKTFKIWRKLTSWIPNSHVIESWIINKL